MLHAGDLQRQVRIHTELNPVPAAWHADEMANPQYEIIKLRYVLLKCRWQGATRVVLLLS